MVVVYVLLREPMTLVVDGPENGETILRVFANDADCKEYQKGDRTTVVREVGLSVLWGMVEKLNMQSVHQYKVPVRVDLCRFTDHVITVRNLHKNYGPAN